MAELSWKVFFCPCFGELDVFSVSVVVVGEFSGGAPEAALRKVKKKKNWVSESDSCQPGS